MTTATQTLHNAGQSIWLDNIARDLLESGTLERYIDDWSVIESKSAKLRQAAA